MKKIDLTGKRVLRLTLSKKPFEIMVTGEKPDEYRKPSKWIESRVYDKKGNRRNYDYVIFTNGYGSNKPYFITEFKESSRYFGRDCIVTFSNGLMVSLEYGDYIISTKNILEIGNYENTRHAGIPKNGSYPSKNNINGKQP